MAEMSVSMTMIAVVAPAVIQNPSPNAESDGRTGMRNSEASATPPGWYGWLHHTFDTPPTQDNYKARDWEKPHRPNYTGTPSAWRPRGSTLASGKRPQATGDYKAWSPND